MSLKSSLALLLCVSLFSTSSRAQSPYPRIKIGGPLGQLVPNGIQLGAGLGSLVNQLIGAAESQTQQQAVVPNHAPSRSPQQNFAPNPFRMSAQFAPQELAGLFSSASQPLAQQMSSGLSFGGHSSQQLPSLGSLGSTNSQLLSHSSYNSQLFDN